MLNRSDMPKRLVHVVSLASAIHRQEQPDTDAAPGR
jgi:hypothetical protein